MKIKESGTHCLAQNMLERPDALGNKGIDFFEQKGIEFVYGYDKADIGISLHGESVQGLSEDKCILFKTEPPIYNIFFGRNLHKESFMNQYLGVICDYMIDNYPVHHFLIPREFKLIPTYFDRPKNDFLCMVLKNKTLGISINSLVPSLRKYKKYSNMKKRKQFDKVCCEKLGSNKYQSYGRGWDKRCFKGSLPGNQNYDVIASHKFTLAIENCSIPGYVTEKMMHTMFFGSIPIYLGATDVEKYVPKNTFIDVRDFDSYDKIIDFIVDLTEEEINSYRKRIKEFVTSNQSYCFSSVAYAKNLLNILEKDGKLIC